VKKQVFINCLRRVKKALFMTRPEIPACHLVNQFKDKTFLGQCLLIPKFIKGF
jgi:hypothetical protein